MGLVLFLGTGCYPDAQSDDDDSTTAPDDDDSGTADDDDSGTAADDDSGTADDDDSGTPPLETQLLLINARVLDANQDLARAVVAIDDGMITAVLEGDPPPDAVAGEILDLAGATLMPGLVDSHVHVSLSGATIFVGDTVLDALRANLAMGVTTVVDVGGPIWTLRLRDRQAAGDIVGPRLLASGPFLTRALSHPCEELYLPDSCVLVDGETEAGLLAGGIASAGPDSLKIVFSDLPVSGTTPTPRLALSEATAIVAAGAALGVPTTAHVVKNEDVRDAAAAGATYLAHPPFLDALSSNGLDAATNSFELVHSTLAVFEASTRLVAGHLSSSDPDITATVPDRVQANWDYLKDNPSEIREGVLLAEVDWRAQAIANVTALIAAGAPVAAGSDAGSYFVPHGLGLHRELELLVEAGMTAQQAIAAATVVPAIALGFPELGLVEAGKVATLIVVDGDPLLDITQTRNVQRVLLAGESILPSDIALGGNYTMVTNPLSALQGATCFVHDDCGAGLACDLVAHSCVPTCNDAWSLDECADGAYCSTDDGLSTSATALCRPGEACNLYTQNCEPAAYGRNCQPVDLNSTVCQGSGPKLPGEYCYPFALSLSCEQGAYCSPIDELCYQLCDPSALSGVSVCQIGEVCHEQGTSWFGLCY